MEELFRLSGTVRRDPKVDSWFASGDALRQLVQPWFEALRGCGADVRETLHDGHPTACAGDAAFAYVDSFAAHANLGFFYGSSLEDPSGLLQGAGKRMRHVKLHWEQPVDADALMNLVSASYRDIRLRLAAIA